MNSSVITCNAGSSNTKLAVFDTVTLNKIESYTAYSMDEAVGWLGSRSPLKAGMTISAIGHRVVHGGDKFTKPELLTPQLISQLEKFIPLAPLHQPAAFKFIAETKKLFPDILQVACFDTAFHHSIPELEKRFALPKSYYDDGVHRYGFHGISYEYIASVLPNELKEKRVIVAHLGNGSSMCAMKHGKSMATTMGFSTLDGLMMGTRCGSLDAGVVLHLLEHKKMSLDEINKLLYKNSGLLGVSGISNDMRELLASNKPEAKLAVELYCYIAAKELCSLLPTIGGIDALIFTGGIGEHAQEVRTRILRHLEWLGKFEVLVIPTNEELMIAKTAKEAI